VQDIVVTLAFIGSSTNPRVNDLRDAAGVVPERKMASTARAMLVADDSCTSAPTSILRGIKRRAHARI
jgi:3-isopropylmalate/(R)-2-methylmalate dehydratase large subunit